MADFKLIQFYKTKLTNRFLLSFTIAVVVLTAVAFVMVHKTT